MGRSPSSDLTSAAPRVTEAEVALCYDVQESIGHGAYGEALLALRREDGLVVVIKRVRISDLSEKEREGAINEVKLLAQFHHSNIVRYYECIVEDGTLNIVMEYADEGELSTVLQSRAEKKKPYKEDQIMFMFVQLALALFHVHGKNVLHRDLKSANVFLSKGGVLKLGDFGISRVLNSSASMAKTAIGTPYYLSPEILEDQPYNAKSDVWALGCILYELTTLKRAFDGAHLPGLIAKILRGVIPPIPTKYSSSLRNLVTSMLQQRPQDRPSVQQILRQDYVRQYVTRYARHMMDLSEGAEEEPVLGIPEAGRPPPSASGSPNPPKRRSSGVNTAAATASPSPSSSSPASGAQTPTPRAPAACRSQRQPSGTIPAAPEPSVSGQGLAGATVAATGATRQAAPVNRRRWSASKRHQVAQEKREVADLPDDPRKNGGAPSSSLSDHQGLEVHGLGAVRISPSALPPLSRGSASADDSFNQAAVSISAQVNNPQPTGMVGAGTRVRPRGPGFGGTRSQGATSSGLTQGPTTPTSEQHVKMDVRKTKYEMENQQKVKAAREHKAQMKIEKDRREREEAAKLREEKRAAKLLKEQEDAKKAKDKEEQRARQVEQEAQLREKASLKAQERQESRRRLQEHKESLKAIKPTLDRASLRRDFAARQHQAQGGAEGEDVFVPATVSAEESQQQQQQPQPQQEKPPSPVPARLHYHSPGAKSPTTASPTGSPQKKTISSKLAALTRRSHDPKDSRGKATQQPGNNQGVPSTRPATTPPTEAGLPPKSPPIAAGRRQRRLWSKTKAQGPQIPAVEIYVPSLKVWEDEEEDEEEAASQQGQEQQQTKQAEARAEVTDGLRELRDFMNVNKQRHDPVKQICDERKDRELLQVLEEMEDVLDWEAEEDGRGGTGSKSGSPPPQQQRLPQVAAAAGGGGGADSSPPVAEATAARVERLRDSLERQLGFERFLSVYKHLRSAQDGEGGAQGSLEGIVGPDEMHLLRDVSKLMIMEDKVFA